jgi:hypothetical protein
MVNNNKNHTCNFLICRYRGIPEGWRTGMCNLTILPLFISSRNEKMEAIIKTESAVSGKGCAIL